MPQNAHEVRVHHGAYERERGGGWLVIDGPFPDAPIASKPLFKGHDHALVRPYAALASKGSPNVGHVMHAFGTLRGRDPRVLASVAIAPKSPGQPSDLIPHNLFVFPGVSMGRAHGNKRGDRGSVHHISVRERNTGGLQVYPHLITDDGKSIRRGKPRQVDVVPELGGIIHLGELFTREWQALDAAGIAAMPIENQGIWEARKSAGRLVEQPFVRNHYLLDLDPSDELLTRPNFLWQSYFFSQRDLGERDIFEILDFHGNKVNPLLSGLDHDPDYDGGLSGHLLTVPLDFDGPTTSPFDHFNILTTVMPGHWRSGTGLVGFADFNPFLSRDMYAHEEAYRTYAAAKGWPPA